VDLCKKETPTQADLSRLHDTVRFLELEIKTYDGIAKTKEKYLRDVFGGSDESSPIQKASEKRLEAACCHSGREYCRKYGQICYHTKKSICPSYEGEEASNSQAN
jgi:hypothetical protein